MEIANLVKQVCLYIYLQFQKTVNNRNSEFMVNFTHIIVNNYKITKKPIIHRNLQASSIIDQIHQKLEKIIQNFELYDDSVLSSTLKLVH